MARRSSPLHVSTALAVAALCVSCNRGAPPTPGAADAVAVHGERSAPAAESGGPTPAERGGATRAERMEVQIRVRLGSDLPAEARSRGTLIFTCAIPSVDDTYAAVLALGAHTTAFGDVDLERPRTFRVEIDPRCRTLRGYLEWGHEAHVLLLHLHSSQGFVRGSASLGPRVGGDAPIELELDTYERPRPLWDGSCLGEGAALDEHTRRIALPPIAPGEASRAACVTLPPSYDDSPQRRYPVVYSFGRSASAFVPADASFQELGEALWVELDTWTPHGTSFITNGPTQGDWEDFVAHTLVDAIDERFRTLPDARARSIAGSAGGGFIAVSLALRHPEIFGGVAVSTPDALDLESWLLDADGRAARPEWLGWMRVHEVDGGAGRFSAYAASWSPDPARVRGYAWPFDLETGEPNAAVWSRWLANSPMQLLRTERGRAAATALSGRILIRCARDGTGVFESNQRFHEALERTGVEHVWHPVEEGHHPSADGVREVQRFVLSLPSTPPVTEHPGASDR